MAEADPPDRLRIEHRRHGVPNRREHRAGTGMKQQRLLVTHQKLIELQIELLHKRGDAKHIRCDLGHSGHGASEGEKRGR